RTTNMNLNKPAIAIVEDNTDLREELEFFLQNKGYTTWGVNSAEAFWKHLHQQPAQIVLLDIGLPGEDGLSVLSYLHSMNKFRIIDITAVGQHSIHKQDLQQADASTLVKLLNHSHLVSSIDALLFRHNSSGDQGNHPQSWQLSEITQVLTAPHGQTLKLSPQE